MARSNIVKLPSHILYTTTGNPFFLSAKRDGGATRVLRNKTDEDLLSPFPRRELSTCYTAL